MRLPFPTLFAMTVLATPVLSRENCEAFPPRPIPAVSESAAKSVNLRPAPELAPVPNAGEAPALVFLGDSLTSGAGAKDRTQSYPNIVSRLLGGAEPRATEIYAIGGQPSTTLVDLFETVPLNPQSVFVIWVGRNNYQDADTVVADVKRAVERLPSDRYLVLSVLSGRAAANPEPKAFQAVNAALKNAIGDRLVTVGDSLNCDDWADNVHLNEQGYGKIAATVADALRSRGW